VSTVRYNRHNLVANRVFCDNWPGAEHKASLFRLLLSSSTDDRPTKLMDGRDENGETSEQSCYTDAELEGIIDIIRNY
jgi:hypothetical protein